MKCLESKYTESLVSRSNMNVQETLESTASLIKKAAEGIGVLANKASLGCESQKDKDMQVFAESPAEIMKSIATLNPLLAVTTKSAEGKVVSMTVICNDEIAGRKRSCSSDKIEHVILMEDLDFGKDKEEEVLTPLENEFRDNGATMRTSTPLSNTTTLATSRNDLNADRSETAAVDATTSKRGRRLNEKKSKKLRRRMNGSFVEAEKEATRINYTEGEIEALFEGVEQHGLNFRSILLSDDAFHCSRTPVKLYDKWRHDLSKTERGKQILCRISSQV